MSSYDEESQNLLQEDKGPSAAPPQLPLGFDKRESHNVAWSKPNILTLDSGGLHTMWSLLALQKLIEYIAIEEQRDGVAHSFFPQAYPKELSRSLWINQKRLHINEEEERIQNIDVTRRYLPCHYFDYICGSGTGSLVAIMLGQFRMTVWDCMIEYPYLAQEMFGRSRTPSTLLHGVGIGPKYNGDGLAEAFKEVTNRRSEQSQQGEEL